MPADNILFQTNSGRTQRQAQDFEILPLTARTTTESSAFFSNPGNFRGIRIYVEVTASSDTPSVTFAIQARNRRGSAGTAVYHALLTSAAVTGASSNCYEVYPGEALVANVVASRHVGMGFRVTATHGDADSITYRILGEWLP